MADIAVASQFIEALTGSPDTPVTFQVFSDDKKDKSRPAARHMHGTLAEHAAELDRLNEQGAGIFVTVNMTDGNGRSAENITGLRALFVDFDNCEPPAVLPTPPPSIVVRSGRGPHLYWKLAPNEVLEMFGPAQTALINALGTDSAIKDLPRVMRLPGFDHIKEAPLAVTIEDCHPERVYSIWQVIGCLPKIETTTPARPPPAPRGDRNFKQAQAWMAKRDPAIEGSGGDLHTYLTACQLVVDFALDDGRAMDLLSAWNQGCQPPWKDEELTDKLRGARKYGRHPVGAKLSEPSRGGAQPQPSPDTNQEPPTAPHLRVVPDGAVAYVKRLIPDAPVTDEQVVPGGWEIHDEQPIDGFSIKRLKQGKNGETLHVAVIPDPVVVQSWVSNNTTGLKCQRIAWKALGKWRSIVVDNSKLSEASQITKACADKGFRVNSTRAKDVVDYLDAYWQTNRAVIPNEEISEQMGWQRDGSFIAGRRTIGESSTTFHANDAGDDQIADFVAAHGSLDAWADSMVWLAAYPSVQLAVYAALAPPLLDQMGIQNFIIDWSYRTSTGKSTALNVAASVWGRPGPGRYVGTWNTTRVAIERRAAVLSGLPLILDDTKQAPVFAGQSLVSQMIYEIASSSGKSRGSVKGTRSTARYNTVLLTSGESRIIDYSKDGGTAGRAISLWGHPFNGDDVSAEIGAMNVKIARNFGHLGPLFIEYLLKNRDKWPEWSADLDETAHQMTEMARGTAGGDVAARICRPLAVIALAGRLCHEAVPLPWQWQNPVAALFPGLTESLNSTDRAKESAEHAYRWALANRDRFYGQRTETENGEIKAPQQGWLGHWTGDGATWSTINFLPERLIEELHKAGYDARACIRLWGDRGWLKVSAQRKTYGYQKICGLVTQVVQLKRNAVPEVDIVTE